MSNRAQLERYIPMVTFISEICGKNYEVILHDVSDPENSVISIFNGHLSGRKVGDPMTELARNLVRDQIYETQDFIANYEGRTRNGKPRADQRRERHARQTDVQYDRLFLAGIQFPRHFRAEELAHPLAQHVPQNAEKRSRRNGKPPQQERTEKQQQKRRRKHPEPPGIDRCFIRRNSVPPFHVFSPENSTTPHTSLSTK